MGGVDGGELDINVSGLKPAKLFSSIFICCLGFDDLWSGQIGF